MVSARSTDGPKGRLVHTNHVRPGPATMCGRIKAAKENGHSSFPVMARSSFPVMAGLDRATRSRAAPYTLMPLSPREERSRYATTVRDRVARSGRTMT